MRERLEPDQELDGLAHAVLGAAIDVHCSLGPGFLESVYEEALVMELASRGIPFEQQAPFLVRYKGVDIAHGRIDLLVGKRLVVELKATDGIDPLHVAQVIAYLKATGLTLGLLINFNVRYLSAGIRRLIRTP